MKKHNVICPYCNAKAVLRPASDVYGISEQSSFKHLYVCSNWPKCDAYVSAHNHNRAPMGTLANGELRNKRIRAHKALEQYRKLTHMEKWAVYVWLQGKLGIEEHQLHIAKFSDTQCDQVIALCTEAGQAYRESRRAG